MNYSFIKLLILFEVLLMLFLLLHTFNSSSSNSSFGWMNTFFPQLLQPFSGIRFLFFNIFEFLLSSIINGRFKTASIRRLTARPRTIACSFTIPFSALNAFFAFLKFKIENKWVWNDFSKRKNTCNVESHGNYCKKKNLQDIPWNNFES